MPATARKPFTRRMSCCCDRRQQPLRSAPAATPADRQRAGGSSRSRRGRGRRLRPRGARAGRRDRPRRRPASRAAPSDRWRRSWCGTSFTPARAAGRIAASRAGAGGGVEQVGLVEDDQVGAAELVLEQLLERAVVIERRDRRRAGRPRARGSAANRPARRGRPSTTAMTPSTVTRVRDLRPVEGLHQRLRQGEAGGLDDDVVGRVGAVEQLLAWSAGSRRRRCSRCSRWRARRCRPPRRPRSPQLRSSSPSTPISPNSLTIEGEAAAVGVAQQVPDQRGLAGAEEAGDDGGGDLGGHRSSFFRSRGRPAAMK